MPDYTWSTRKQRRDTITAAKSLVDGMNSLLAASQAKQPITQALIDAASPFTFLCVAGSASTFINNVCNAMKTKYGVEPNTENCIRYDCPMQRLCYHYVPLWMEHIRAIEYILFGKHYDSQEAMDVYCSNKCPHLEYCQSVSKEERVRACIEWLNIDVSDAGYAEALNKSR